MRVDPFPLSRGIFIVGIAIFQFCTEGGTRTHTLSFQAPASKAGVSRQFHHFCVFCTQRETRTLTSFDIGFLDQRVYHSTIWVCLSTEWDLNPRCSFEYSFADCCLRHSAIRAFYLELMEGIEPTYPRYKGGVMTVIRHQHF